MWAASVWSVLRNLRRAGTDEEKKAAFALVRGSVSKHVSDLAEKYLIPGEVQTPAIMFVPSESLYADLHDSFADVIQKAHRANVIVVSPNILMLAINPTLTLIALFMLPILTLIGVYMRPRLHEGWEKVRENMTLFNIFLAENIAGMRVIQAFVRENVNLGQFRKANDKVVTEWMKAVAVSHGSSE